MFIVLMIPTDQSIVVYTIYSINYWHQHDNSLGLQAETISLRNTLFAFPLLILAGGRAAPKDASHQPNAG